MDLREVLMLGLAEGGSQPEGVITHITEEGKNVHTRTFSLSLTVNEVGV